MISEAAVASGKLRSDRLRPRYTTEWEELLRAQIWDRRPRLSWDGAAAPADHR